MEQAKEMKGASRVGTRSVAFVGLSIALMAVSAWVSVPFGPVPFTLQTFVMVFALLVLTPGECLAAIGGYLVIGAVGLPVFSSMRGGIGVVAGPTGGFLWGFLLGAVVALAFLRLADMRLRRGAAVEAGAGDGVAKGGRGKRRALAVDVVAGFLFLLVMYVCGWIQLMGVAGLGPEAAFATAVAPFLIVDGVKLVAGVLTARAVRKALPRR
ncbi:biotin transporter BioY [Gordonibacter sp. 28C]|uniref:biotin transporter BioY n=1 Tax=Gordonibacter sp. 28C TaxID=2078569 RepID=UPI000DF83E32|nr:biotin transporter BioY [Gordonibacter sp. 28C]RDB64630.1 biotin transporter BioY [Gordonibacter sp. 28C]